ncbi:MAG: thioredoxin domain-containing protein [Propionibacteriaceae bacterium]|jgi:protein-disulfide isomerase|nr:thioredoxin domain-containing protein [Propionibacteriaceae bacterium]
MAKKKRPQATGETRQTREAMRQAQAEQLAKETRTRKAIFYSVAGVIIAVILFVIFFAVFQGVQEKQAAATPSATGGALSADAYSVNFGPADAKVQVDVYFDFHCPGCAQFETVNSADLQSLVADGTIYLRMHPMNFEDSASNGQEYSTRAANAFVTVAQQDPDHALAFADLLWENQPSQGTDDVPTDEDLVAWATEAGVPEDVSATFSSLLLRDWVDNSNTAASEAGLQTTPGLQIDGEWLVGDESHYGTDPGVAWSTAGKLKEYILEKAGA